MRSRTRSQNLFFVGSLLLTLSSNHRIAAQTPVTPEQEKATADIHEYFRRTTARLAEASLADVKSLDDWQRQRPVLREQLLEMLGLSPLPERTDLHATVTGTVEHEEFVVEKLHFQSRPGLYVTANFYRPKQVDPGAPALPTILYLCGHGNVKIDGVSYGSKASYQYHPAWFAREGYCCLILDTLQLGEIEGLHHGTYREGMWWWPARGFTPAGVEAWNAVRALDYLETRPEVDMKRIGVTGRSGGGAYTWWLAGIDDRPACLVPVAGITDLRNHVVDGCIEGHCDCMYMVNTYQWDFPTLAALAAPRPLLFSNTDKDRIFPLDGVVRTHAKLKKIYDLYGAADKLGLLITEGPHKDTQELQVPAFRWMNRWLQNRDSPITRVADKPLDPTLLKVFDKLPAEQRNTTAHEWFVATPAPAPPKRGDAWNSLRETWLENLKANSFRGWPGSPPPLGLRRVIEKDADGVRLQIYEFTSDENVRLSLLLASSTKRDRSAKLSVFVGDDAVWREWSAVLRPRFGELLADVPTEESDATTANVLPKLLEEWDTSIAFVNPRGTGPNAWNADKKKDTHIQRRFLLLGESLDAARVWDVCRSIQALHEIPERREAELELHGRGPTAGIALYAGLFSPQVKRLVLASPSTTHRDGPYLTGVLRTFDLPQAAAMFLPREIHLYQANESDWRWTRDVERLVSPGSPRIKFLP